MINIYIGKNQSSEENLTDKDKVLKYFNCIFGDDITLLKVYQYENLKDFCEQNNITKEFVLNIVKEYLKIK